MVGNAGVSWRAVLRCHIGWTVALTEHRSPESWTRWVSGIPCEIDMALLFYVFWLNPI